MKKFELIYATLPDKEQEVAEIWYGNKQICEINQENSNLEIEIYAYENNTNKHLSVKIPFEEFLVLLNKAKQSFQNE